MTPDFLTHVGTLIVGAVAAYFGAMNAMRERLAKLEARADSNKDAAEAAHAHANSAHARIDSLLTK